MTMRVMLEIRVSAANHSFYRMISLMLEPGGLLLYRNGADINRNYYPYNFSMKPESPISL